MYVCLSECVRVCVSMCVQVRAYASMLFIKIGMYVLNSIKNFKEFDCEK